MTSDNTITTICILCTHRYTWWPSLASIDACVSDLAIPTGEKYVSEAEELGEWHRLPTGPLRGDLPKCCQFPVSVSRSSLASGFYFDIFPSIEACKNTKPVTLVFIYIPDFFQRKFVSLIHWGEKKKTPVLLNRNLVSYDNLLIMITVPHLTLILIATMTLYFGVNGLMYTQSTDQGWPHCYLSLWIIPLYGTLQFQGTRVHSSRGRVGRRGMGEL